MTVAAVLFLTVGGPAVVSGASGSPAAAFKAHCSSRLTYRQLSSARAPGQCVDEHGQVFQYRAGAGGHSMLLDVTDTGGGILGHSGRRPVARIPDSGSPLRG